MRCMEVDRYSLKFRPLLSLPEVFLGWDCSHRTFKRSTRCKRSALIILCSRDFVMKFALSPADVEHSLGEH